jgi:hypothetical protein
MKSAPAFLSKFIQELQPAARQAALGTGLTAGFGLLAGGPTAALAYGAGDFLLNVPAIALARRFSPGTFLLQNIANIGASVATYPVVDLVTQGRLYKDRLPTPQEQYFYPGIGPLPESVREQLRAQA